MTERTAIDNRLRDLEAENARLRADLRGCQSRLALAERDVDHGTGECELLAAEVEGLRAENGRLRSERDRLRAACHGGQGAQPEAMASNLVWIARAIESGDLSVGGMTTPGTLAAILRGYAQTLYEALRSSTPIPPSGPPDCAAAEPATPAEEVPHATD